MRRVIFWILLLLFAIVTVWWVLYVPREPERLYKAIPHGATILSSHSNIAERWEPISRNPITRSLLQSSGLDLGELDKLSRTEEFRFWLESIASDEVVMAYIPYAHPLQSDVWVFTSWIGGWSQRLRWMLRSTDKHDCSPMGMHAGRRLWTVKLEDEGGESAIQFALVEGALIGCLSKHPEAIRYVLDVYDGRAPGAAAHYRSLIDDPLGGSSEAEDRGWFSTGLSRRSPSWTYELIDIGPAHLEGSLSGPKAVVKKEIWRDELDVEGLARVMGDLPFVSIVSAPGSVLQSFEQWMSIESVDEIRATMSDLDTKAAAAFVLGDEYSGRLKGLKWPGLVVALQLGPATDVERSVSACLDRLNADHKWGLIRAQQTEGEIPLYIVESTADTFYAKLFSNERLAYAVCGKWLILSSNALTLKKLLARYQTDEALRAVGTGRWEQQLKDKSENVTGFGWTDLEQGGKALRLAISAYAVKLMFEDAEKTQAKRQQLNEMKAWIDAVVPLEELQLRMEKQDGRSKFAFELGHQQKL